MKLKSTLALCMASLLVAICLLAACTPKDDKKHTISETPYGNITTTGEVTNPSEDVTITLIRGRNVVDTGIGKLTYDGALQAGDVIEIAADYSYINVDLFPNLGSALVYSPSGQFTFQVPSVASQAVYETGTFAGTSHEFSASVATASEIAKSRNLAVNPYDYMYIDEKNDANADTLSEVTLNSVAVESGQVTVYPHAYANRITRNEVDFYARNAIDGSVVSNGHGNYPYQSWGYNQKDDAEFVVYFGREVKLDSLAFVLRADFSGAKEHDTYWQNADVEFSDGTVQTLEFSKTGEKQEFVLDHAVSTKYVRIRNMIVVQNANSEMYAALTEFEAYGQETVTKNPVAVKTAITPTFGGKDQSAFQTSAYSYAEIKATMDKAIDWFIDKTENSNYQIPDYNGNNMQVKLNDDDWKDAVYYSGLMEAFLTTGDMNEYYFLRSIGNEFAYLNNNGKHTPHGDHYQIGETYLQLNDLRGTNYKMADSLANAEYNLTRGSSLPSGDGIWYDTSRDWSNMGFWWCDALYMALNTYTLLSRQTGETKYVETAYNGYLYWKDELYNTQYNLWHRDSTQFNVYTNLKDASGNPVPTFWSRGNAWVLAALAKQLLYLDENEYPEIYETYKNDYLDMAEAIAQYQREDGTWNASIVDESYYGGKETTGTCGFIYAYCIGLRLGLLDADIYYPIVERAYNCVVNECMFESGQVGYMQTTGYQPQNYRSEEYSKTNTHEFGMGLFLLASSGMMSICSDYVAPSIVIPADPQAALLG